MVVEFQAIYGVSKQSTVRGKRRSSFSISNTRRIAYGIDKNGRFKTEKVGFLRGIWLTRLRIFPTLVACAQCGRKVTVQARKPQLKAYICVRCS